MHSRTQAHAHFQVYLETTTQAQMHATTTAPIYTNPPITTFSAYIFFFVRQQPSSCCLGNELLLCFRILFLLLRVLFWLLYMHRRAPLTHENINTHTHTKMVNKRTNANNPVCKTKAVLQIRNTVDTHTHTLQQLDLTVSYPPSCIHYI